MDIKDKKGWLLFSWLKRGKQRILALTALQPDHPITGEELRQQINSKKGVKPLSLREVSRHLSAFKERGLVKCLDEDAPYGKHYILTALGSKMKTELVNHLSK